MDRVAIGLLGALLAAWILQDLVVSVVVPRPASARFRVSTAAYRLSWRPFVWLSRFRKDPNRRERLLGSYAPVMVLLVLVAWVAGLVLAYGLILWSVREELRPEPQGIGTALYASAVSFLTIGFGDVVPVGPLARFIVVAEAATGLGTVALVISFLFSLYGNFQRREALVVTLDAFAGAPPSGVLLLETAQKLRSPALLAQTFDDWRRWSAEVLDSHLAYPNLNYFRSLHDNESWVSALGAVLDAATLVMTAVESETKGSALLMYGVGVHLVEDLSHFFGFDHEHEVGIDRFEFDDARKRLETAGYRLRDPAAGWEAFVAARSAYAAPLNAMARRLEIPPALWIGDRSLLRPGSRQAHV